MMSVQVEDSMERERKGKGEVERSRRKVEGDLKLAQELIVDKERYKIYITLYKIFNYETARDRKSCLFSLWGYIIVIFQ